MGAMRVQNSGKSHFGEQRGADFLFGGIWACTESETPWTGRSETAPGVWTICRLTDKTVGYETLQSMERLILLSKASDHVVYPTVLAVRGANPEGIASLSPGLRAARYPGCVSPSTPPTLKGLHRGPAGSILAAMPQSLARILVHTVFSTSCATPHVCAGLTAVKGDRRYNPFRVDSCQWFWPFKHHAKWSSDATMCMVSLPVVSHWQDFAWCEGWRQRRVADLHHVVLASPGKRRDMGSLRLRPGAVKPEPRQWSADIFVRQGAPEREHSCESEMRTTAPWRIQKPTDL